VTSQPSRNHKQASSPNTGSICDPRRAGKGKKQKRGNRAVRPRPIDSMQRLHDSQCRPAEMEMQDVGTEPNDHSSPHTLFSCLQSVLHDPTLSVTFSAKPIGGTPREEKKIIQSTISIFSFIDSLRIMLAARDGNPVSIVSPKPGKQLRHDP